MKRRTFLAGAALSFGATFTGLLRPSLAHASTGTAGTFEPLRLALSTPGRLGFYVDYSERTTTGIHTFYVCRTHGTTGTVSVDYSTSGDAHTAATGTFTWRDGEADIKFFTVEVPTKEPGIHRINANLSNATGGAVLHFGEKHTTAYGVIDDGSISSDAVFFDTSATTSGTGSVSEPYNNIYDAISNAGTRRYIYGTGTVTVDGTNLDRPFGQTVQCISPPASRAGESDRLCIQQWPGKQALIVQGDGASNNQAGFLTATPAKGSWITYRGISFRNLSQTDSGGFGGGIGYIYSANGTGVNIERCSFENIDAGDNVAAIMPWGATGWKIWRCTANNIQVKGSTSNQNATGLLQTYDGASISIQRCRMSNCSSGTFHKRIANAGVDVSLNLRFNHFIGCIARYSASGLDGASHSFSVVQGNLFQNITGYGAIHHLTRNPDNVGQKAGWWCNNIFDSCGSGEIAAIHTQMANGAAIFNNIMLNCRRVWTDIIDESPNSDIEFADNNVEFGTTYSQKYEWRGIDFSSAPELHAAAGFEGNAVSADPQFQNIRNGNYRLSPTSPALTAGVGGSSAGIFLTGAEIVGPKSDLAVRVPEKMPPVTIS
ncbi:hypothetical protein [Lentisalinibacter sediminis]|uniref:hypothetical protein n=1 Tax=Lentisalinibacter sediminis TaxID=2992237 RepID=UPI00386E984D